METVDLEARREALMADNLALARDVAKLVSQVAVACAAAGVDLKTQVMPIQPTLGPAYRPPGMFRDGQAFVEHVKMLAVSAAASAVETGEVHWLLFDGRACSVCHGRDLERHLENGKRLGQKTAVVFGFMSDGAVVHHGV